MRKFILANILIIFMALNAFSASLDLALDGVQLNGSLSAMGFYTFNRNDYNKNLSQINVSTAMLWLHKDATKKSPFGFFIQYGKWWPSPIGIDETKDNEPNSFELLQGYVEYKTPYVKFQAGKYGSIIGPECGLNYKDPFIEKGLVWWGELLTFYTGARMSGNIGPISWLTGIHDMGSNDGHYAFEGSLGISPIENLSLSLNTLLPDKKDANYLQVYDFMLNYNLDNLALSAAVDILRKDSHNSVGYILMGTYTFNPAFSLAGRVEYIDNGKNDAYTIGANNEAYTFTLTPKYSFNKYFYIRGEGSFVYLNDKLYENATKNTQARLVLEMGIKF